MYIHSYIRVVALISLRRMGRLLACTRSSSPDVLLLFFRFGPGETATWKPAAAGEVSPFASALRAVDAMDPDTARLMLYRGEFHRGCLTRKQ